MRNKCFLIATRSLFLISALLKQIETEDSSSNGSANHENTRRRRRTNSGHRDSQEPPEPVVKNYTPEQVEAVTK